ncbi:MAG TPA: YibE/F family protein [Spirochaetota bacterium]|nr:YibE/F family protein [Spirochaetota bacterium]
MEKISRYILLLFFLFCNHALFAVEKKIYIEDRVFARAKIEKIERIEGDENNPYDVLVRFHLLILYSEKKGERPFVEFKGEDNMPKDMFYKEGDVIFVGIGGDNVGSDAEYVLMYDIDNSRGLFVFGVILLCAIILVGRFRSILSMLSLLATIVLLFYVLIPMTLKGYSALPLAVAISIFAIVITIPIILGFQKKTLAAICGASSGVLIATMLALLAGWIIRLSGIVTNEMMTVFYASSIDINLKGLAMSAMVVSALGAIMDVCISIASATDEIFRVNPEISFKEAFKSIITVSSDMLGATVNTLMFAYVGGALPLVLMISLKYDPSMPILMIFNNAQVLSDLISSAIGCIGMFLSMPATAVISIELHKRSRGYNQKAA